MRRSWTGMGTARGSLVACRPLKSRGGFTLVEMLMTVSIIAILSSVAIPQYDKAVRRGRLRGAADILQTIYSGEQVFRVVNRIYTSVPASPADSAEWAKIFMDSPNIGCPNGQTKLCFIVFAGGVINPPPNPTTFIAEAFIPPNVATPVLRINETGTFECLPDGDQAGYTAIHCP